MRIEGQYTLPGAPADVWVVLLDQDVLAACVPGCQKLQMLEDEVYEATLSIGVAAIRGTYQGRIRVQDKQPPATYRLDVTGSGVMGTVTATGLVELVDQDGMTLVRYAGNYQVAGRIAAVGQRLIQPAAHMLTTQFFRCVEQRLATPSA